MSRTCIVCNQSKSESDFNWRDQERGLLQSVCKSCQSQQSRDRYANNPDNVRQINQAAREKTRTEAKKYVNDYLSEHPCTDCGETDPDVLTFDHVKGDKRGNISDMVQHGYSIRTIQEEIDKTEVVCSNDHLRRERKRRGN